MELLAHQLDFMEAGAEEAEERPTTSATPAQAGMAQTDL